MFYVIILSILNCVNVRFSFHLYFISERKNKSLQLTQLTITTLMPPSLWIQTQRGKEDDLKARGRGNPKEPLNQPQEEHVPELVPDARK